MYLQTIWGLVDLIIKRPQPPQILIWTETLICLSIRIPTIKGHSP